jgi:hypothetical protein
LGRARLADDDPHRQQVCLIKDLTAFASSAGLTLGEPPTIVIATADAFPLQSFQGESSMGGVDEIVAAIEKQKRTDEMR